MTEETSSESGSEDVSSEGSNVEGSAEESVATESESATESATSGLPETEESATVLESAGSGLPETEESATVPESEPSNEELLAEILREEQEEELIRLQKIANGSLPSDAINDLNWKNETHDAQQLTQFQETIITTGSQVSYFLLSLLLVLFVVQSIRKSLAAWRKQRALQRVGSVLDEGNARRAEEFTPFSEIDQKAYAVYNTILDNKEEFVKAVADGATDAELQPILLKRAFDCIDRFSTIQRDSPGIRKNWNLDLLPKNVWDDFNAAQANIQHEIEEVNTENVRRGYVWGEPFGSEVFACARQQFSAYVQQQRQAFAQRMQQRQGGRGMPPPHQRGRGMPPAHLRGGSRGMPPPGARMPPGARVGIPPGAMQPTAAASKTKIPDAKGFGSGLQRGFLNPEASGGPKRKLTRREKKREKQRQLAAEQNGGAVEEAPNGPVPITEVPVDFGSGASEMPSQTQPRKRKGKRRFGKR